MFKIIIPLTVGSMTRVGPGISLLPSEAFGEQVSAQVCKSGVQVELAIFVLLTRSMHQ